MSPAHPPIKEQQWSKPQQRLRRYIWASRISYSFAIASFLAGMLGLLCLPHGAVSPKATGSLFAGARAAGWFLADSGILFGICGILALCATGLWVAVRTVFRPP